MLLCLICDLKLCLRMLSFCIRSRPWTQVKLSPDCEIPLSFFLYFFFHYCFSFLTLFPAAPGSYSDWKTLDKHCNMASTEFGVDQNRNQRIVNYNFDSLCGQKHGKCLLICVPLQMYKVRIYTLISHPLTPIVDHGSRHMRKNLLLLL